MFFPTKNDHFGAFWGYHHLRKHQYGTLRTLMVHTVEMFPWGSIFFWGSCQAEGQNQIVLTTGCLISYHPLWMYLYRRNHVCNPAFHGWLDGWPIPFSFKAAHSKFLRRGVDWEFRWAPISNIMLCITFCDSIVHSVALLYPLKAGPNVLMSFLNLCLCSLHTICPFALPCDLYSL